MIDGDLLARDVDADPRPPGPVDWDEEEDDVVTSSYHGPPIPPHVRASLKALHDAHMRSDGIRTYGQREE